ncbi:MAG: PAC2 family protein [Thermoflexales bacterium]|nr:PAC2 family protein [Thermoflexales bacterium]MDW8053947.1 PAC2 family protein [Anaerolineae bacterium]MDW8292489.1 PAC2 family protein [Anaerolineae bacterium]
MQKLIRLFERPRAEDMVMIAGWRQWADAGAVSSGLLTYLIDTLKARKIGEIDSDEFFLFQTPVSQFLFRPQMKFEEGYRKSLVGPRTEVFFWGDERKGVVLFLGDEPQMRVARYAEAFFELVQQLNVRRVAATGGVYAAVPYDKERAISCTYSLPRMKEELSEYAVSFSNYEGGVSIGSYLNDLAERRNIEYFTFYAFVPAYDLSQILHQPHNIALDQDYKAWYDIMVRLNHMFRLGLDLRDLQQRSEAMIAAIRKNIDELSEKLPSVPLKEYLARLTADFVEKPFTKLDEVWEHALEDVLKDIE